MGTNWKKDRRYRGTAGAIRRDQAAGQERVREEMRRTDEIRARMRDTRKEKDDR